MTLRLFVGGEKRFGSVVDLVRRACELGADKGDVRVGLQHYSRAYRVSAERDRRNDASDPFVMPMDQVQSVAAAMRVSLGAA